MFTAGLWPGTLHFMTGAITGASWRWPYCCSISAAYASADLVDYMALCACQFSPHAGAKIVYPALPKAKVVIADNAMTAIDCAHLKFTRIRL